MKGFTILEVIIATAIASVISVALFIALRQTMEYQGRVDTFVDTYTRAALFQNQLERDFMGFFVPNQAYELITTSTKAAAPGAEQKKPEQIDKIFYATANKDQFQLLTFITTNAMQVYWGKTMGTPKPLVTRVLYRLVKIKGEEDSFTLMRQESGQLDLAAFEGSAEKQKTRAYEIVGDIKEMKVSYFARVYKVEDKISPSSASGRTDGEKNSSKSKDSKSSSASSGSSSSVRPELIEGPSAKKLPTWSYREFTEWDWSPKKAKSKDGKAGEKPNESEDKKEQVSRVPMYIKVNLVLWNAEHTRTTPFEFVFVRKPFEMKELEQDTPPQEKKPAAQMPSLTPILDLFKAPVANVTPQSKIVPVALPQQKQSSLVAKAGGR